MFFSYISKFSLSLFLSVSYIIAFADDPQKVNFSGIITDGVTKQPLPGASVYISDIKSGVIADDKGKFIFTGIPSGHHLIEISYAGYASIVEHVDMESNLEKNFELQPSIVENRGVIVTGVASATSLRKAPIPVTLIRKSELMHTATITNRPGYFKTSDKRIGV
jgi:iron complex outermembrane recepter protein